MWTGPLGPQRCPWSPDGAYGGAPKHVSVYMCEGTLVAGELPCVPCGALARETGPWCGAGQTQAVSATGGQQVEKESHETCGLKEAFEPLSGWH